MPYDEALADRIRAALAGRKRLAEVEMFGGLCFKLRGNMCCGIVGDDLLVRVGPEGHRRMLAEPHARPMDFTGRPLKGFIFVGPAGYRTERALAKWLKRAIEFASSLPAK